LVLKEDLSHKQREVGELREIIKTNRAANFKAHTENTRVKTLLKELEGKIDKAI
jgi:hypothetical protein